MNQNLSENPTTDSFFTKPLIIICVTVFIDLIGFGIFIPLLPFYGKSFNATPFEVELLFGIYSLMQFIFAPILGSLSDKYGRRPILFLSLIGSGVGYVLIGYAGALWMIFLGRIISGVTGGNISVEKSRLDFDMEDTVDKEATQAALDELVAGDHAVSCRWITDAELDAQPELVRTMSVQPPRGKGEVRLLEIQGVDLQPCGGTHVHSSAEVGKVRIGKVEKKGRRNRRVNIHLDD